MWTRVAKVLAAACCLVAMLTPNGARAQIPDKFTNLEVLPKDISKRELVGTMKGFSIELGVRCHYCHVGEEGMLLDQFDFASDEKAAKRKARVMIKMRDEINETLSLRLGELRDNSVRVACVTCHRGQPVPRMLEDVLSQVIATDGVASAIETYRDYRERYYGGFSYDFGEMTLSNVAAGLIPDDPQSAIAVLELNLEFYPASWVTLVQLGDAHAARGEKEQALAAYEEAFKIRPHPMLKQKIASVSRDQ